MKELEIQVSDDIREAFDEYCERNETDHGEALQALIEVYAMAYLYKQKKGAGKLTADSAAVELDKIIEAWLALATKRLTALPFPLFLELEGDLVARLKSTMEK
jgi:hypothetical protein